MKDIIKFASTLNSHTFVTNLNNNKKKQMITN